MDHHYAGGPDMPLDALITATHAGHLLNLKPQTVAYHTRLGRLQRVTTPYGRLYRMSDVLQFADKRAIFGASGRLTW